MKEDTIPETIDQIEDLELEREVECIDFEIGDHVVYPHHGAGQVMKKEDKEILGEVRQYLTIKILHNDMTVMVPCENAGKAGLRRDHRRRDRPEGARRALGRHLRDAQELEPPLQAQPRQDQDGRHLRARRGRPQPRHPRAGQGPVDGREADVHAREEDPGLRADVRAREVRGRGRGLPRPRPHAREAGHRRLADLPAPTHDPRPCGPRFVRRSHAVGAPRSSWPPAAASASAPAGPRRSSRSPAGRWSSGRSTRCARPASARDRGGPARPRRVAEALLAAAAGGFPLGFALVEGGATRSESVRNALAAAGDVDGGARARRRAPARRARAVRARRSPRSPTPTPRSPPRGSPTRSRRPGPTATWSRTLDRSRLWAVQTPQAFRAAVLRAGARRRRRTCSPRATDDAWLVERAGGQRARRRVPAGQLQGDHAARPGAGREPAVLTDYHLHLRPDERGPPAGALLHAGQRRALPRGRRGARHRRARRRRAHPPLHAGARGLAAPLVAPLGARRRRRLLRASCARRPTCGSASRPTSCAGREDRIARFLEARDWDYVVGSVHFVGDAGVDLEGRSGTTSGAAAIAPTASGSATSTTLAEAARSGLYDIMAHPDLVKIWGGARPLPERDPRRYYEPAIEAIARGRRGDRGLDGRAAQARRRALPGARRCSRWPSTPGCPIALSSDAHAPDQVGYALRRRARGARGRRRERAVRVRAARAADGADRVSGPHRPRASTRTPSRPAGR